MLAMRASFLRRGLKGRCFQDFETTALPRRTGSEVEPQTEPPGVAQYLSDGAEMKNSLVHWSASCLIFVCV